MPKRKKSFDDNKQARQVRSGTSVSLKLNLSVLAGVTLIVLVAFFAYLPSINGGFILDDNDLLTENKLVAASDGLSRFWCTAEAQDYWPVTNSTFWIEWRLWRMNSTGYHVTNLFLHIVETLLIWVILRKISIPGAFLVALLLAVHPVNVESVAWIASRKNIMAMLFFLLSILWYLKADISTVIAGMAPAPSQGGPWEQDKIQSPLSTLCSPLLYCLSLAAFAMAMLSKGSAVMLPVLLLGILWWLRSLTRRDLLRIATFFLLAVVLTAVNIWFQTHGKDIEIRNAGFRERLLGAGGVVWFYLYKALLPIDLAFIYPQWRIEAGNPLWWLPLLAVLVVTGVLWRYRKDWSRPFLFAWGVFCVSLVPVLGFTDVGFMIYSLVADHYQHIAIIGVIALVAAGWSIWHERMQNRAHWLTTAVAVVVTGTLTFLTWQQSGIYNDAIELYKATLQKNPGCWLAHNCLGCALDKKDRLQEAVEHYQQALRLKPDYANAHLNLGVDLAKTGRLPEAIEHYKQALRLKPDSSEAHNNLGVDLVNTGRVQEAIEHYEQALRLKPDYANAHNNLGVALVKAGRLQEAIEHYEQALLLKPDYVEARNNLGVALAKAGRLQEAIELYEQAIRLKLDYANAYNNLGDALAKAGRLQEAIKRYQQALRLKPDSINTYYKLALAYAGMKQSSEAIAAAQKGLELARSAGQTNLAKQIEDWLNSYRAGLPGVQNTQSAPGTVTPPTN